MMARPCRHVVKVNTKIAATITGNQPPVGIFSRLEAKKAKSKVRNIAVSAIAAALGQRQFFTITIKNINVVSTMVPVAAMP